MSRNAAVAIGLAIVLRAALFPFAENKHSDAPMRALIAERMVLEPASAAVPRTYCQFGPLHTTLMRPFIALDPLARRSSRYLSLLAGIAVLFPFLAFADAVPEAAGHWKLAAIDRYAGPDRPLAWIDDAHDERCTAWAQSRPGPTLLIGTEPATGITEAHVARLLDWAEELVDSANGDDRVNRGQPRGDAEPGAPRIP